MTQNLFPCTYLSFFSEFAICSLKKKSDSKISLYNMHFTPFGFFYLLILHGCQLCKKLMTESWNDPFLFSKTHHPKQSFQTSYTDFPLISLNKLHLVFQVKAGILGEDTDVYDFPEPVWPYANRQVLNPWKALCSRGLARVSYTVCWLAKEGSPSSTEQKEKS